MKFLLLGALLIGAPLCQSAINGYEDLIMKLNYERREHAKISNISNMYELHWTWNVTFNPDIKKKLRGFFEYFTGKDWRGLAMEARDAAKSESIKVPNAFYPLQQEIGCASRPEKYRWRGPRRVYDTLCYVKKGRRSDETFGVLGSGCGDGFHVNGLCREDGSEFEVENVTTIYMHLLAKLNFERREYAKAMKISNMYKLEWNEALWLLSNAPQSTQTPNFQTYFAGRNRGAYMYETRARNASNYQFNGNISKWDKQVVEEHENGTLNFLAHLVPEQKALGCTEKPYVLKNKEIKGKVYNLEYDYTCYLGPERSFKNSVWKFGAPGTGCGSDKVEDGLCVGSLPEGYKPFGEFSPRTTPPPITTSSSPPEELKTTPPSVHAVPENSIPEELRTPSPPIKAAPEISNPQKYEEFLAKLNYDRRELAKAMDVANMFKLVWNDENAKIAHQLSQKHPIENIPGRNYRHFFAGRNKEALTFEKEATKYINALSARGTLNQWTDRLENQTVTTLEQFVPTQTEIGCTPFNKAVPIEFTDLKIHYSTICVLTPTSSFKNAETKIGPAGSECGSCQVEDGLCVQSSGDGELQCLP
ncbi:unnamed protein product [Caenorhabditis nigoni]